MTNDMVMRSVYLRPLQDNQLRQLAHTLDVTKSDLIRAAISSKLMEWLQSNDREKLLEEVALGLRDEAAIRSGRRGRARGGSTQLVSSAGKTEASPPRAGKTARATSAADSPATARDALV